ncbi:MAG TPA: hypothetical protein VM240_11660 [Verrucomicrobiae bacterium]|nr:hypothetical protein [Verrucomicrobiae bacterium]
MGNNMMKGMQATALGLAMVLAPVAQAFEKLDPPSRDTGVGHLIAHQGNEAIAMIRAEAAAAVRAWAPLLPPAARAVKASQPAGSNNAVAATVRAAK